MAATKEKQAPATAEAIARRITDLERQHAAKVARLAELAEELAAARVERDRLYAGDAPAKKLAEYRTRARDLEDEHDGTAGAVKLIASELEERRAELKEARRRDAAEAEANAIGAAVAAYEALDAALREALGNLAPLIEDAQEKTRAAGLAERHMSLQAGGHRNPLAQALAPFAGLREVLRIAGKWQRGEPVKPRMTPSAGAPGESELSLR
jgi:chromosome segregation ATPase